MKRLPFLLALIACAVLVLVAVGCGGGDDSSSSSENGASGEATTTESSSPAEETSGGGKTKPTVTVPKGVSPKQFAFQDVEVGTGATAKKGDTVAVQYVGVGYDSEKEFDSSWSRNEPFTFTVGAGQVIQGWERGVVGMKEGGRRELLIPANLAYGEAGSPPVIGPNETLIFVIDLLAVE